MNYIEVRFTIKDIEDYQRDILADVLATIGFESFEDTEIGVNAYAQESLFDEKRLKDALFESSSLLQATFEVHKVKAQNWNEIWESNFEPITVGDTCYVRATFHPTQESFKYQIIINPKMAFGTGHHQTTYLMMAEMLKLDLKGKRVLDMGCGTGILAILASQMGASRVMAIDYDEICVESVLENNVLNNIKNVEAVCGSREAIPNAEYDVVLANINRNILLEQMDRYVEVLSLGGLLLMSGFYVSPDLAIIQERATELGLVFKHYTERDNWAMALFERK